MRYFSLSDTPDVEQIFFDEDWLEAHRSDLLPRGCKHFTPESRFEGLTVAAIPATERLSWISPFTELKIAESDLLLEILGAQGISAVDVIPVAVRRRSNARKYLAFLPKKSVLVRGESTSTLKGACSECGLLYYWPQPARNPEKWYLVRASLKGEAPIYTGSTGGLILREDIVERVKKLGLRRIRLRELPVLDQPLDGLPADLLSNLSSAQQQELGDLLTRDVTEHDRQWAQQMANVTKVEKGRVVEWNPPKKKT